MPDCLRRCCVLSAGALALAWGLAVLAAPPLAAGWHPAIRFDVLSPLAAKPVFVERIFPPTLADRLQRFERASGVLAREHTVDLGEESFDVYVPAERPPAGYALMVFNSPMPVFPLPRDWRRVLDARGMVFVSAHRADNAQNVFERRLPLALHAHENVLRRLPVDPARTYVAGFSGGSRMAQRLALAYADVFRGVLLVGGSDPFGEDDVVPPHADRMQRFREETRVVFATGGSDLPNMVRDRRTRESFSAFCVAGVETISLPRTGH